MKSSTIAEDLRAAATDGDDQEQREPLATMDTEPALEAAWTEPVMFGGCEGDWG